MVSSSKKTGFAKSVLVMPVANRQLGTITTINAVFVNTEDGSCYISPENSSGFSGELIGHYNKEIIPLIDKLCTKCNLSFGEFSISVENLQAAALCGTKLEIEGYSADLSVFIAMLSAVFDLPVDENVLFSGHISQAKILPVESLKTKIETAINYVISKFYCARININDSLSDISKEELDLADDAIRSYRREIKINHPVDVFDTFDDLFDDSDLLLAAIKKGLFGYEKEVMTLSEPVDRIAAKLSSFNMHSFRNCVFNLTLAQDHDQVCRLWNELLAYHITIMKYPAGIGQLLYQYMCQLPPHILKSGAIKWPFIAMDIFIKISQFALASDYDDLGMLFDAMRGKYLRSIRSEENTVPISPDKELSVFDTVASKISMEYFNEKIGIKIDQARAGFVLPSTRVDSHDEFNDTVKAYYHYLCNYTNVVPTLKETIGNEALNLLERSYADNGGYNEAYCRALDGSKQGMLSVLDEMTKRFKNEEFSKYVNAVFHEHIDIRDDQYKRDFVTGALQRLEPFLPPNLKGKNPDQFLHETEKLARIYVNAVDSVKSAVSRLG